MSDAMRPVVGQWVQKLRLAWESKKREFQDDADECARYFDGPYNWRFAPWKGGRGGSFACGSGPEEQDLPGPSTQMTINKTAELVQLFGPALYHRNPVRKATPRHVVGPPPELYGDPNDPQAQAAFSQDQRASTAMRAEDAVRGDLYERYLNFTPTALDLKTESRWAITEALIKGMGCLWTRTHEPPGGAMSWAGTFYDSVDNLQMDPDASNIRDIKWMARRRVRPVWEVERERGLPAGSLKAHAGMESYSAQASVNNDPEGDYRRKQGRTADLIVYHEIYSKMGLGGRLAGHAPDQAEALDQAGDYCYLEVCENCPYPLNLPPPHGDALTDPEADPASAERARSMLAWPTPFWAGGQWPMTPIAFHWKPGKLWPMSHMKPGLGELAFLNWAWSFLASKVRRSSRDFIAIAKSAAVDLKDRIKHGPDYTIIEVEQIMGSIDSVVKFLQHPNFNSEIYQVIQGVTDNFEKRVGLTELVYGMSGRQLRSAQEAQLKSDAVNVRPDDMANTVEDAMTDLARKEAFCARWHLRDADVRPVLGPIGAGLWEQLIVPSDPSFVLYSLDVRIEANSARKPNKAREEENMRDAVQNLFQPLYAYAQQTGDVGPVNALIEDWAKSKDLDAGKYRLQAPPPPPAPASTPGPGPNPAAPPGPPPGAPNAPGMPPMAA